jgi:hypothetical protein
LMTIGVREAIIKHSGGTRITQTQPGVLTLEAGDALISASKQVQVVAGDASVRIQPGSVVLVTRTGNTVKIRNLCENSTSSVKLEVGGRVVAINAGQELIVASSSSISKEIKAESIGRRRLKMFDISSSQSISRCDVSLVSLMQNADVLRRIVNSNNAGDRALVARLIKIAACLGQITNYRGAYSSVGP